MGRAGGCVQAVGCAQGWGCGTGAVEPHFLHVLPKLSLWEKRFGRLYRLLRCVCQEGMASGGERMGVTNVLHGAPLHGEVLSGGLCLPSASTPLIHTLPWAGGGTERTAEGAEGRLGAVTKVTELSTWLWSPR